MKSSKGLEIKIEYLELIREAQISEAKRTEICIGRTNPDSAAYRDKWVEYPDACIGK
jgi:hypothetical protein